MTLAIAWNRNKITLFLDVLFLREAVNYLNVGDIIANMIDDEHK